MATQREIVFKGDDSQYSAVVDRLGKNTSDAFEEASGAIDKTNSRLSDFSDSVESELDKVRQSGRDLFEDMVKESEKVTGTVKDRLSFLQRELSLQEKLVAEEREREKIAARMERDARKQEAADMGAGSSTFTSIDDAYDERMNDIRAKEQLRTLQMRGARGAYDEHRHEALSEDEDDEEKKKKGRGRGSRVAGVAAGGFNAALGAAGFGAVLTLAGFVGKAISEGEELSRARTSFSGLSNRGSAGVGPMYDLKTADSLKYAESVAQTRGSIRGIAGQARGQYSFEKAYSLEAGEMNSMNQALRLDTKGRSSSDVGIEMLNFFKQSKVFGIEKNDFTKVSELLGINNELNNEQVEQLENIDPTKSTMLMRMLGKMGVDSSRITSYTAGLNSGITNPKDEYSQAIIYRALRDKNPNMSLFELQERQEQGIYGKGNLSAVMNQFGGSASGEMLMKTVSNAFGLKNFQSRNLVEAWEKDHSIFDDDKGISKARQITEKDVAGRASNNTTVLQGLLVRFNDTFAGWGEKMLNKLGEYVNAFDKGGFEGLLTKIGSDIKNAVVAGFKEVYNYVTGKNEYDPALKKQLDKNGRVADPYGMFSDTVFDLGTHKERAGVFGGLKTAFGNIANKKFSESNMVDFPIMPYGSGVTGKLDNIKEMRNVGNDNLSYEFVMKDYIKNKNLNSVKLRGSEQDATDILGGSTNEQLRKALYEVIQNKNKYDKADGDSDGTVQLTVLKGILKEMQKANQPKSRENRVKTGK